MTTLKQGKFEQIGTTLGQLVDKKNAAYGDAFHKTGGILQILYPEGIKPKQYEDLLAIVRILDKFFRIATHPQDQMGESPWNDVAGYGILKSEGAEDSTISDESLRPKSKIEWPEKGQRITLRTHEIPFQADTSNVQCPYCSRGVAIKIDKSGEAIRNWIAERVSKEKEVQHELSGIAEGVEPKTPACRDGQCG